MSDTVDVIYVLYRNHIEALKSVEEFCLLVKESNYHFSIFLIDNSFNITSQKLIQNFVNSLETYKYQNIKIRYFPSDSNLGFGKGCNKLISMGISEKIIVANCDTSFRTTSLDKLVQAIDNCSSKIPIVGPKIITEKGLIHSSCFSFDPISIALKPMRHIRYIGKYTRYIPEYRSFKKRIDRITYEGLSKDSPSYVDWVSGCFMIIERSFFNNVNGFDPRFFLYFEDVDLARKARNLGLKVLFDPSLEITHQAKHSSRQIKGTIRSILLNITARYHISSWIKYMIKWRRDFITKIIYKLKPFKKRKSETSSESLSYSLDFSLFEKKND